MPNVRRECRKQGIHQNMSIFRRTNFLWEDVLHVFHYEGDILDKCPIAEQKLHILSIAHDLITVNLTLV